MPQVSPVERAQQILDRLGIARAPVNVEKIARGLDAQVRYSPLDDELSGMVYIKNGVPIIGVNSLHHLHRQRFTIAHEIGHLELHRKVILAEVHVDKKFPILLRDAKAATGIEKMEIEANSFAAALLMPTAIIVSLLEDQSIDIDDPAPLEKIAKKFKVSRQALEFRIRNLN